MLTGAARVICGHIRLAGPHSARARLPLAGTLRQSDFGRERAFIHSAQIPWLVTGRLPIQVVSLDVTEDVSVEETLRIRWGSE